MKMIKLTRIDECSNAKAQFYLNPEHISSISRVGRETFLGLATGEYATVTQTPARILKLIDVVQQPVDAFAGLGDDPHGDDFMAFDKIDEMLAAVELIPGELIRNPDTSAPAKVKSISSFPGGAFKIVLEGKVAELGHVQVGDTVLVSTGPAPSERVQKYQKLQLGKAERLRLTEFGFLPAPPYSPQHSGADLGLLLEFNHELDTRDDEIWMEADQIARLITLGWVCALSEGLVLDAKDYVAARSDETNRSMVFVGLTTAGVAMAKLNARGEVA